MVVTINYRLGLFGFLSESHLNAEGHPWGNYGILDSQAALRWVQANIAAFGGDPNKVTLGGQSAGASDTSRELDIASGRGAVPPGDQPKLPHTNFLRNPTCRRRSHSAGAITSPLPPTVRLRVSAWLVGRTDPSAAGHA